MTNLLVTFSYENLDLLFSYNKSDFIDSSFFFFYPLVSAFLAFFYSTLSHFFVKKN